MCAIEDKMSSGEFGLDRLGGYLISSPRFVISIGLSISFEDDLSRLIDEAQPSLLFEGSTPEDFCAWQERFRDVLTGLIGPRPERAALCLEFEEEIDCGLYVRRRISYQTEVGVFVPAYLLIPKGLSQGEKVPLRLGEICRILSVRMNCKTG